MSNPPVPPVDTIANLVMPESVTVTFPKWTSSNSTYIGAKTDHTPWARAQGDLYAITTTLASIDATKIGSAGSKLFHDSCKAVYTNTTGTGTPTNQTFLAALALRIATDYYANLVASDLDIVFGGIAAWVPEGADDILIGFRDGRAYTRIQRKPWNYGVEEMSHTDVARTTTVTSGGSTVSPILISSLTITEGFYYPATLQNWGPGWSTGANILYVPTNGETNLSLTDRFIAVKVGTSGASGLAIYAAQAGFTGAVTVITNFSITDCIITQTSKVMTFTDGRLVSVV